MLKVYGYFYLLPSKVSFILTLLTTWVSNTAPHTPPKMCAGFFISSLQDFLVAAVVFLAIVYLPKPELKVLWALLWDSDITLPSPGIKCWDTILYRTYYVTLEVGP